MAIPFELLPLSALGEHSITMDGEDEFGTAYFVDGTMATLGDPPRDRVRIVVDLSLRTFDRVRPDFLSTTKGIPLFSERFIRAAGRPFSDEVDLVPATLSLNDGERAFFAARARKTLPLIDPRASTFSRIGGVQILTEPVLRDPGEPFLLARDDQFRDCLFASSDLIAIVKEQKLRVHLAPY